MHLSSCLHAPLAIHQPPYAPPPTPCHLTWCVCSGLVCCRCTATTTLSDLLRSGPNGPCTLSSYSPEPPSVCRSNRLHSWPDVCVQGLSAVGGTATTTQSGLSCTSVTAAVHPQPCNSHPAPYLVYLFRACLLLVALSAPHCQVCRAPQ